MYQYIYNCDGDHLSLLPLGFQVWLMHWEWVWWLEREIMMRGVSCMRPWVSWHLQFSLLRPYQQLAVKDKTIRATKHLIIYLLLFGPVSGKLRSVSKFLPGGKGPCLPVRSPTGHASWLVGEQDDDGAL